MDCTLEDKQYPSWCFLGDCIMLASKVMQSVAGAAEQIFVDDVFSVYTYTGNGSTQTITNGIDLAGKGGLVWTKGRNVAWDHVLYDTTRGTTPALITNSTVAQTNLGIAVTSFASTGYTLGSNGQVNTSGDSYVSWTFRNADKFYNHTLVTKTAGSNATVSFANLGALGMVRVKRTDSTGSWYIWHRSLSAGQLLIGETTAAAATLGHLTVSGTTVTLVNGVIADGTYLVEGFAHDTTADGIIQCGTYTGTTSEVSVNLGLEPQFVLVKCTTQANQWVLVDTMRGASQTSTATLFANGSGAESVASTGDLVPTATGFTIRASAPSYFNNAQTYIYLAIRRPNKPPTTGTQVYTPMARGGTGSDTSVTGVGFTPDAIFTRARNQVREFGAFTRLQGASVLIRTTSTDSEVAANTSLTSWGMDGATGGSDSAWGVFNTGSSMIHHWLRRAPGVFGQICYNGSGANKTEPHNLTKAPELWMVKRRNSTGSWTIGSSLLNANEKIVMPSPNGRVTDATAWNSTYPTVTALSLGTQADVNASGGTYVAYLWASTAGISKVFTYTGNGTSQTIDCGFTTGARFVMIIRVTASTAQDIYIWDSARGITSGNDPRLSLNTTAAEVTTLDTIDPASSGFIVNQDDSNANVNGAVYIGLAYA